MAGSDQILKPATDDEAILSSALVGLSADEVSKRLGQCLSGKARLVRSLEDMQRRAYNFSKQSREKRTRIE